MSFEQASPATPVIEFPLSAFTGSGKWIETKPDGRRIGDITLRSWDIRPISRKPSAGTDYDGYLIQFHYELALVPGAPRPKWMEVGFDFTASGSAAVDGARTVVRDAIPRAGKEFETATSYHLNQAMLFVAVEDAKAGQEVHQPAVSADVEAWGVMGSGVRWLYQREGELTLRAGTYSSWAVVLVPQGSTEISVEADARYELARADRVEFQTAAGEGTFTISLKRQAQDSGGRHDVARPASITPTADRTATALKDRPQVFISYAHDDDDHKQLVREFANFLHTGAGIYTHFDQWYNSTPRPAWKRWATCVIPSVDFNLVIASPRMRLVGDYKVPESENLGLRYELEFLGELLQEDESKWEAKVLPVILPGGDPHDIPRQFHRLTKAYFEVHSFTPGGAEELLRTIIGKPNPRDIQPPIRPTLISFDDELGPEGSDPEESDPEES